ncbi:MAG: M20/M25/M40 family metallo-hydrolase [bacterium]|nr:M20/M25/M40 family metallo-hydrolase [bacterium]
MINEERLIQNFLSLTKIEGISKNEREVADELKKRLDKLNIPYEEDDAGKKISGNCGNLIAALPGTDAKGITFCFTGHMDTIASSHCEPEIRDGVIYSDGKAVLGADDRAGIAAALEAVEAAKELNLNYPDIELIFLVAEEIGLLGSRNIDFSRLKSKYCFVLDSSSSVGKIIRNAPTHMSFSIEIKGKSAHAAIAPQDGVNAIKIAAEAISNIDVGRINEDTTVNFGTIKGGTKTNNVPDLVEIEGELRSLSAEKIPAEQAKIEKAYHSAAEKYGGKCIFDWDKEYSGFLLDEDNAIIDWVRNAMRLADVKPELTQVLGGSDANNFNEQGIPSLNLGIGYAKNHSPDEYMPIEDLVKMANICLEIIKYSANIRV